MTIALHYPFPLEQCRTKGQPFSTVSSGDRGRLASDDCYLLADTGQWRIDRRVRAVRTIKLLNNEEACAKSGKLSVDCLRLASDYD